MKDEADTGGRDKMGAPSLHTFPALWLTSSEPQPQGTMPKGPLWRGWSSSAGGHSPSGAAGRAQGVGATGRGSSVRGAGGRRPEVCGRPGAAARWS